MEFVFHSDLMAAVLSITLSGMLGIFLTTGVIISCVCLLNRFTS